ncbi:MAG: hypothetical protein ACRC0L_05115, partial [Angustibacter sp.]
KLLADQAEARSDLQERLEGLGEGLGGGLGEGLGGGLGEGLGGGLGEGLGGGLGSGLGEGLGGEGDGLSAEDLQKLEDQREQQQKAQDQLEASQKAATEKLLADQAEARTNLQERLQGLGAGLGLSDGQTSGNGGGSGGSGLGAGPSGDGLGSTNNTGPGNEGEADPLTPGDNQQDAFSSAQNAALPGPLPAMAGAAGTGMMAGAEQGGAPGSPMPPPMSPMGGQPGGKNSGGRSVEGQMSRFPGASGHKSLRPGGQKLDTVEETPTAQPTSTPMVQPVERELVTVGAWAQPPSQSASAASPAQVRDQSSDLDIVGGLDPNHQPSARQDRQPDSSALLATPTAPT